MTIKKSHNFVYCTFYEHDILFLPGMEIRDELGKGKDVLSAHGREVNHSKQVVCIIFRLIEFYSTVLLYDISPKWYNYPIAHGTTKAIP